jgi:fluoroacetyl-CoA thioesterase
MHPLEPGLTGTASLTVGEEHTANSVGSGTAGVLATPVMINLIETAALNAIETHLPETSQSLGIYLEVSHVAATPVGMTVTATAKLIKVDGRHLEFKVHASDEVEEIGAGMHRRIIVNVEKFASRVARKIKN